MRDKLEPTSAPGVFRRRADGRYVVRAYAKNPRTGRVEDRSRLLPPGARLSDAREVLARLETAIRDGTGRTATPRPPSFAEYAAEWVARRVAKGKELGGWRRDGGTQSTIEPMLRRHFVPTLGPLLVDRIRPTDLEAWLVRQAETEAAPSTIAERWRKLVAILRAAAREHGFADPTASVTGPKGGRRGGSDMVLTPEQIDLLRRDALEYGAEHFPVLVLGFATGARVGELLGARVGDFDLDGRVPIWTICRHVLRGREVAGRKCGDDAWPVRIDPWAAADLRPHFESRFAADLLFPGRRPGTFRDARELNQYLREARDRIGLPLAALTSKCFRQTYATHAPLAGISTALAMAQTGHVSETAHQVYRRFTADQLADAATRMGQVIWLRSGTDSGTGPERITKVRDRRGKK